MKINLSIVNPFSSKYHCMREFKENLSRRQQVAAVAAAIFASIIPVLGSTAAFRKVVNHYHPEIPQEWQGQNFIHLPSEGIRYEPAILARKLTKEGVNPDNKKFTSIWTAKYAKGNNNLLFGADRACYSPEDRKSFETGHPLTLYLAFPDDLADAKQRTKYKPNIQVLTFEQAFGDEPLPRDFVDFMKK